MLKIQKYKSDLVTMGLLMLSIATSAFVSVEPAPTDIFFILFLALAIVLNQLYFSKSAMFGLFLVVLFLLMNFISFFFVTSISMSIPYIVITIYMAVMWIGVVGFGGYCGVSSLKNISSIYYFVGLITAVVAIAVYFRIIPYYEEFFLFERVKLFFKDPNVLGPFLIFPALYAISKYEEQKKMIYMFSFFIITSGVILSFSRAAWLNLAVAILVYLFLPKFKEKRGRLKVVAVFIFLLIAGLALITTNTKLQTQFTERLGIQHYDAERFNSQKDASLIGFTDPLGNGPGQSEVLLDIAPHNLFARLLIENGLLGVTSFILLIVSAIVMAFKGVINSGEYRYYYMIIFSTIIGQIVNSLFIDTLHWRHLWLIVALAWIPYKTKEENHENCSTDYKI